MSQAEPLRVVLCWHMHQPQYRDPITGRARAAVDLPARHQGLRRHGGAPGGAAARAAVVNFTPVLIEQIRTYSAQISRVAANRCADSDPVLALLTARRDTAGRASARGDSRLPARPTASASSSASRRTRHSQASADAFLAKDASAYAVAPVRAGPRGLVSPRMAGRDRPTRRSARRKELIARERDFDAADCRLLIEIVGDISVGPLCRAIGVRWQADRSSCP